MDFQALCEIADREFVAGIGDEQLVSRSHAEAGGVEARARQIYWHLRAKQLLNLIRDAGSDAPVRDLLAQIEAQEHRLRSRKQSYRWFWAVACITGLLGCASFPPLAFRAVGKNGPAFYIFLVLSIASLALAALAYLGSRYHTHTE